MVEHAGCHSTFRAGSHEFSRRLAAIRLRFAKVADGKSGYEYARFARKRFRHSRELTSCAQPGAQEGKRPLSYPPPDGRIGRDGGFCGTTSEDDPAACSANALAFS